MLDARRDGSKDFVLKAFGFYQGSKPHLRTLSSPFAILPHCVHLHPSKSLQHFIHVIIVCGIDLPIRPYVL